MQSPACHLRVRRRCRRGYRGYGEQPRPGRAQAHGMSLAQSGLCTPAAYPVCRNGGMGMNKPRLLDMGCCAGGAGRGYALAGFEVTGIDLQPQPRYPYRFMQADMFTFPLDGFDAYHVSPHCQRYSRVSLFHTGTRENYPDQIDAIRERLSAT